VIVDFSGSDDLIVSGHNMWLGPREKNDGAEHVTNYVNPEKELNAGLWSLFSGATVFLFMRVYCKITRGHGLWYDDYVLILAWVS
jgi:hypothetical protein